MVTGRIAHPLHQDGYVFPIDATIRDVVHEASGQMDPQPSNLTIFDAAVDIGLSSEEGVKLHAIITQGNDQPLFVGSKGHLNQVFVLVFEGVANDVVK